MRTLGRFTTTLGVTLVLGAGWIAGCQDRAGDCDLNGTCPTDAASTSSTGTAGGGGSGTGGDGGGGMDPGNCDPAMGVVDDGCGVFASSSLGVQGALGGKTTPVRSLQEAVDLASETKRVYACAEVFDEAVTVAEGITIYGGLDCANDWALLAETKSEIAAPDDVIALTIGPSATGFGLNDFVVRAADATVPGGSSIGVLVDAASVRLTRCDVFAGKGADGVMGDTPTDSVGPTDPADATIKGNNGKAACLAMDSQTGGASKVNALCATSIGGGGGGADTAAGFGGNPGQPAAGAGQAGTGDDGGGNWSCLTGGGQIGANGATGTPGDGAQGQGSLSSSGYAGESGMSGGPGTPGQGGGGGGGAKGKTLCAGASGGSGGAGGCPGAGGFGGTAGGASIGLALLEATVTFEQVTVKTAQGGKGGDGGFGQGGGIGGLGGVGGAGAVNAPATLSACAGGQGGQGGFGGKGGGGRGGHSVGIAHTGTAPSMEGIAFTLAQGGAGGLGADAAHDGAVGVSDEVLNF